MKKTIIALACLVIGSSAFAASITTGTSNTHPQMNGNYVFDGVHSTQTTIKSKLVNGDKTSKTKTIAEVYEYTDHAGLTNFNSGTNTTFMNAGTLSMGTTGGWTSGSQWSTSSNGASQQQTDRAYVRTQSTKVGKTISTGPDGKEIVKINNSDTTQKWLEISSGFSSGWTTTFAE